MKLPFDKIESIFSKKAETEIFNFSVSFDIELNSEEFSLVSECCRLTADKMHVSLSDDAFLSYLCGLTFKENLKQILHDYISNCKKVGVCDDNKRNS